MATIFSQLYYEHKQIDFSKIYSGAILYLEVNSNWLWKYKEVNCFENNLKICEIATTNIGQQFKVELKSLPIASNPEILKFLGAVIFTRNEEFRRVGFWYNFK
jgi:hypothetical protein